MDLTELTWKVAGRVSANLTPQLLSSSNVGLSSSMHGHPSTGRSARMHMHADEMVAVIIYSHRFAKLV